MTEQKTFLTEEQKAVLQQARSVYGNTNQILVSNEELCELAAVCAKFPRYNDADKARKELGKKAVDEVADVIIVLDHVINIFGLTQDAIQTRIEGKVERLRHWLEASSDIEQTIRDREVPAAKAPKVPCGNCVHYGNFNNLKPGHRCCICAKSGHSMFEMRLGVTTNDDACGI